MNALKGKQSAVKGQLTQLKNQLSAHPTTPVTLPRYNLIKSKLATYTKRVDELNEEIFAVAADNVAQADQQLEYETLSTKILELVDALAAFNFDDGGDKSTSSHGGSSAGIKLPKIEIPSFNGDLQTWTSFSDLFTATIHKNSSLSNAQKLQYLKSALKGDASKLIQSLPITDGNYDEAWDILSDRYNNQREIIHALLKRLFHQPVMRDESSTALRSLIDTTNEVIRTLGVLNRPTDTWDDILVFLVVERLDGESRRQWILSLTSDDPPEYKDLMKFLDQRARALGESSSSGSRPRQHSDSRSSERRPTMSSHHGSFQTSCSCCGKGSHALTKCFDFLKLPIPERKVLIRKNGLCFNCLTKGHVVADCPSGTCKKCPSRHHTLIHQDSGKQTQEEASTSTVNSHFANNLAEGQVLLATALVQLDDTHGNPVRARALLDGGSQASFVTDATVQKLGLSRQKLQLEILGLSGSGVGVCKGSVQIRLTSFLDNRFQITFEALVLSKVTNPLPNMTFPPQKWPHIKNLDLADPSYSMAGQIDILLGADVHGELLRSGIRRGKEGTPIAQATSLGWVLSGRLSTQPMEEIQSNHVQCDLDSILQRFWELEEMPGSSQLSPEEKLCESHFLTTHTRTADGRFQVRLPFRETGSNIGSSRDIALRRFKQLERRLSSSPDLRQRYVEFMREYEELGHMTPVPMPEASSSTPPPYYIPHHAVIKSSSTTTKLRVVFDGSAKTSNGLSLNDTLMVGPKLQDDLFPILIRFRFHQVALCADICKMYRQVHLAPEDWDFQRILWRERSDLPILEYWLQTVTYGLASAPYLATKCTQQLALEEKDSFPLASASWLRDSYVDDLMTGAEDESAALILQSQLNQMLAKGGFDLRKWSSNKSVVLEALSPCMRETQLPLNLDTDSSVKTLGLQWHPASDAFTFNVVTPPLRAKTTKRQVLSDLSKVFDPVGWLSPVIVRAKILFQQLWKLDIGWDDNLSPETCMQWKNYCEDLVAIQSISIPRCIVPKGPSYLEIHGFCDASERAYSAAVYLRCIGPSNLISSHLMTAKTKVSPLKIISIPRLELCGSLLLARLIKLVRKSIHLNIGNEDVYGWTDSTIVLAWLASPSDRWKTFVSNRVSEIQEILPSQQWNHVISEENPADCASRGISPGELESHPLWWFGPSWLTHEKIPFAPNKETLTDSASLEEEKRNVLSFVNVNHDFSLLVRYSCLSKLKRITAWILRFGGNLRKKADDRNFGFLSAQELTDALHCWIKLVQAEEFQEDIRNIREKTRLPHKSRIANLNPYLDESGLLRVGGRLNFAAVPEDRKHPLILPRKHHLTSLIIQHEHLRLLHAGPQLLLNSLQQRYWIICGRDTVRHHIRKCLPCVRQRGETASQMMGQLPSPRVNVDRPFSSTGIDYAGPFHLKVLKGRGCKQFKAYICLFICFTTKAIHLEAVSDLTSGTFIAALQRFVSRRGKSRDLYSDCGTNFVGANKELKEALEAMKSDEFQVVVAKYLSNEGITWHFNPPSAPHQGGLWEAGVKSVKYHLRRVVGNSVLNYEEFYTLLTEVEACLNSRPLCPMTSDPSDLTALTPGHFLIGGPLTAIPEPDLTTSKIGRLDRWQLVQQLFQRFWRRWTSEYLSRLQQRPKWWSYHPNLKLGDLVLVKDDRLPPLNWPLARVSQLHPGEDGQTRVVTVKTANSTFKRPIVKLCHLPIDTPN